MRSKGLILMLVVVVVCSQGCATAQGVKNDTVEAWEGMIGKRNDSWLQKTDGWLQDHLW